MGNTGISRGMGNKGKSPSHLHISFPTKKLPSNLPHQGQATLYPYVLPRCPTYVAYTQRILIWIVLYSKMHLLKFSIKFLTGRYTSHPPFMGVTSNTETTLKYTIQGVF